MRLFPTMRYRTASSGRPVEATLEANGDTDTWPALQAALAEIRDLEVPLDGPTVAQLLEAAVRCVRLASPLLEEVERLRQENAHLRSELSRLAERT